MSISNTNKGFTLVFIASILELGWVLGLKYATTTPLIIATILVICLNFLVLPQAFKYLPTSIAYIIFVGLGTFFLIAFETIVTLKDGAQIPFLRIFFICTLILGVIGVKTAAK